MNPQTVSGMAGWRSDFYDHFTQFHTPHSLPSLSLRPWIQLLQVTIKCLFSLLQIVLGAENEKNEVLREMRQLRRYIHDAFCGKIDEPLPQTRQAYFTLRVRTSPLAPPGCLGLINCTLPFKRTQAEALVKRSKSHKFYFLAKKTFFIV